MSNDSNREDTRTVSPSDLRASDFFPPGEGWNKESCDADELKRKAARYERAHDDESAVDGARPH